MGVEQSWNNMATETYSISPAGEWVDESLCSCQRRDGSSRKITNNSSLPYSTSSPSTTRRSRSSSYSPLLITLIVWLNLTCYVSAWPQRRNFNYYPAAPVLPQQVVLPSDYDLDANIANRWAMAEQPGGAQPDAYYDDLPNLPQQQNMYEDQYYEQDPEEAYPMPYFGSIMPEKPEPEEELELEELKREQPYSYNKRRSGRVMNTKKPKVVYTTPATTAATAKDKKAASSSSSASTTAAAPVIPTLKKVGVGAMNPGQKEVAMLRPPSPKSHQFQDVEPEEPQISVAQRSPSNEKPSAYDTLRKYLSLDDALKKEYQQRRAGAVSRHTKRESISSIITDSDSLTGQLNGLKKKMD